MAKSTQKRKRGRPRLDPSEAAKAAPMTAATFGEWLVHMGWTDSEAARRLGVDPATVGRFRERGGSAVLGLACSALVEGLKSWKLSRKK